MRTDHKFLTLAMLAAASFGLGACGNGGDPESGTSLAQTTPTETIPTTPTPTTPAATPTPTPTPELEPATEVIELAPFLDDGSLAEGWTIDESTLGDRTVSADCSESWHSTGPNTVACGSTADALSACWLTDESTQIACLDAYTPDERTLHLISLDGSAPAGTSASDEVEPLWVELEDGTIFTAVEGGAFSPPEGYLVYYIRADDSGIFEEILLPEGSDGQVFDQSGDQWTVTVGVDGGDQSVTTEKVTRVWYQAGRTL